MKLNASQIERIHAEVGADPIPDSSAVQNDLEAHFGTHTFYVDATGLYVWEPLTEADSLQAEAVAVKVASWVNDERTVLEKHEPLVVGKTVLFPTQH